MAPRTKPTKTNFYTSRDIERILKIKPSTAMRWRLNGKGPRFLRIGQIVRYPVDDFEKWCEEEFDRSRSSCSKEG